MECIVTDHAEKRIRERVGVNKNSASRAAQNAFERGLKHNETTGKLNKYISSLFLKNSHANNIRIYGEKVWIFNGKVLITVLPLPKDLLKMAVQQTKKKYLNLQENM